jgi:hypothetical protein
VRCTRIHEYRPVREPSRADEDYAVDGPVAVLLDERRLREAGQAIKGLQGS